MTVGWLSVLLDGIVVLVMASVAPFILPHGDGCGLDKVVEGIIQLYVPSAATKGLQTTEYYH